MTLNESYLPSDHSQEAEVWDTFGIAADMSCFQVSCRSSDLNVVHVEVKDGRVLLVPHRSGRARVGITLRDRKSGEVVLRLARIFNVSEPTVDGAIFE